MTGATSLTARQPAFLKLQPRAVERPWGGRRLAQRFGWSDDRRIGEWWIASSYPGVETGVLDHDGDLADWLDGPGRERGVPGAKDFPVLLKFLDAEQRLSLQVHPDDVVAAAHGLPRGKTEAWHVLEAARGACVYLGTAAGVTCAELLDRVEAGASDDEVVALMNRVEVQPGDTLFVEAGTVHALDAGVTIFEVQQTSDATYRIHDWGRGRDVHLAAARDAVVDRAPPAPVRETASGEWSPLVRADAFRLDRARPDFALSLDPADDWALLTVVSGEGRVQCGRHGLHVDAGDTLLVLEPMELRGTGLDLLAVRPGA